MATNGLGSGLRQGNLQGVKTGIGHAPLRTGFVGGVSDANFARDKIQDPALLHGEKLPWIYINADYTIDAGNSTLIIDPLNLPDKWLAYKGIATANHPDYPATSADLNGEIFSRTGEAWNAGAAWVSAGSGLSTTNRPYPRVGGQNLGDHVYLDFGGSAGNLAGATNWLSPISAVGGSGFCYLNITGTDSFTVIMVMKSKNTTGKYHFALEGPGLPGGYELKQQSETSLQSTLYGNEPGLIRTSNYNTISNLTDLQDWCLITVKCTVKQKNGQGSEQELYVNGKYQHTLSSTTWTTPEAVTTFPASQDLTIGVDDIASPSANGMYFAAFLMLPYWANESEQLRLENYFRWYYGKKF
jgi:hypothetical protein